MPALATKRVMIEFPEELLECAEQTAAQLAISRSSVIRSALEQYLKARHRQQIERLLAEGYAANASMDSKVSEEFSYVDSETI